MIINATMAITALSRIVKGNEDKIYHARMQHMNATDPMPMCMYAYQNAPDCGVGCALADLGMSIGELYWMDGTGENTQVAVVSLPKGWYFTAYARQIFAGFQTVQDHGASTWGEALERAKRIYRNPNKYDNYGTYH